MNMCYLLTTKQVYKQSNAVWNVVVCYYCAGERQLQFIQKKTSITICFKSSWIIKDCLAIPVHNGNIEKVFSVMRNQCLKKQ